MGNGTEKRVQARWLGSESAPLWSAGRSARVSNRSEGEGYVLLIFVLAVLSRVFTVLHDAPRFLGPGLMFDQLGLRIAAGLGFGPTSMVPPVYPHYLGMIYRTYGYSHYAVVLSHAFLGALLVVVAAAMARALGLSRRYAVLAGLLVALFPQAIAQSRHFSPQLLVCLLFSVAVLFWARSRPVPSWLDVVVTAGTLGLCVLTRSGMVIPALVLLLARTRFDAGPRRVFDASASTAGREAARGVRASRTWALWSRRLLAGVLLAMIVGPWIARNSELHGRSVWIDTTWALRVRAVTIPGEQSVEYQVPGRLTRAPDNVRITNNRLALGEIVGFYITYPGRALQSWGVRASAFFGFSGWNDSVTLDRFPYTGTWYRVAQALFFGVVLSLVMSWLILLRARGQAERLLAWSVAGIFLLMLVAGGVGDGRLAAFPMLVALAMRGGWGLLVTTGVRLREPRRLAESRFRSESSNDDDRAAVREDESVSSGSVASQSTLPQPERETFSSSSWSSVVSSSLLSGLPRGVEPPSRARWFAWGAACSLIWLHGFWSAWF